MSRVTIQDIARRVGVSKTTVSNALRGLPKVSESLRQKIQNMADEMDYRPNPLASGLSQFRWSREPRAVNEHLALSFG